MPTANPGLPLGPTISCFKSSFKTHVPVLRLIQYQLLLSTCMYISQEDILGLMEFRFTDNTEKSHEITTVPFMLTSDRVANPSPIHALATSLSDCSEVPLVEKLLKPACRMVTKVNKIGRQHFVALLNCVIILKLVLFHALQAPNWVMLPIYVYFHSGQAWPF